MYSILDNIIKMSLSLKETHILSLWDLVREHNTKFNLCNEVKI